MGRSVVHTCVYIQRLGCLRRPYRIQMGLEGGLGEGGKIGLGRVKFHSIRVSFRCLVIGEREGGEGRAAVGDCSVYLCVLGVVGVVGVCGVMWCPSIGGVRLRYDGTGAGSAQRDTFDVVGVSGFDVSTGAGVRFGVRLLVVVVVVLVSAFSAWLSVLRAVAVGVVGVAVIVGDGVAFVGVASSSLVVIVRLAGVVVLVLLVSVSSGWSLVLRASAEGVVGVVVVVGGGVVFVVVMLFADASIASQSMSIVVGVVGVGGLGIGLFRGWCLCPWCCS